MPKFFVPPEHIFESKALIEGQEALHIYKTLRLKKGQKIHIFDGTGIDYFCEIQSIQKNLVEVNILDKYTSYTNPPIDVTIFQCLPKANKMDFIIQKTTELGISTIVPVISDRTVVKIESEKKLYARVERWKKIALEACKQSNRSYIPNIYKILSFEDCFNTEMITNSQLLIVLWEEEKAKNLKDILRQNKNGLKRVCFFIGPEGGFIKEEVDLIIQRGGIAASLGPRILRTETAAITVLSILMYELGDLGG
ncbi:MAG TPA: 16S rRNA (uracil(1498)-N(3))-methyltransferase [Thermoanaerobacterales bacterium]|nr:16S rRNA (uracil(1498)-N(3))-methyltransferase [Thermoanaerobacterales bacterium]